jgi:protein O-mannosyl-transferase
MGRKRTGKITTPRVAQVPPSEAGPSQTANQRTRSARDFRPLLVHVAVAAGLCVLVLLAWSNSFGGGFAFDNRAFILNDPRIQNATATNFDLIMNHSYWWPLSESGLYRPLTTLSYLFNYSILGNGDHPAGYHLINLLLHSLNVFLVYLLASRLIKKLWPAVFIAAVWAVHPVLTESVTNIIGRADLLAGLALLSGLLMYLKSTESSGWRKVFWLLGLAAVTAMGVFSKESAVAILGVIVFYELTWWKERKQLSGLLLGCAALAPPLLFMWYQRSVVLAASDVPVFSFVNNPLLGASFIRGRLTAIAIIAKYLGLLAWPSRLSCDYSYNQIPLAGGSPNDWLAWFVVAAVLIAIVGIFRRSRVAFFFAGFAFVCFVPVANLLFFTGTIMAERFLYLPAIGFAGCLVLVAYWIGRRLQSPRFAPISLCLIIAALGVRTWERNFDWRDDLALSSSDVRSAPESFKLHDNFAGFLNASEPTNPDKDRIIGEEEKSLAILDPLPNSLSTQYVYMNTGVDYIQKGDRLCRISDDGKPSATPESLVAYHRALTILLRGAAIDRALNEGHRSALIARGKRDSEIAPVGISSLHYWLAQAHMRLGENQQAYDAASYARMLSPQYTDAYHMMGVALLAARNNEAAAVSLIEGLLVTADPKLFPLVQTAYDSSLDSKNCAFVQTPGGPSFNFSCEIVHNDVCKASSELINVLVQDQQQPLADAFKKKALVDFACSPPQAHQ